MNNEYPLEISNNQGEVILKILPNGDIILRGIVIGNDLEVVNILTGYGESLKLLNIKELEMTLPTYDELVEKMAIALCEKDFGKGSCNIIKNKGGNRDCKACECYPVKYAEAALQALIANLPELEQPQYGFKQIANTYKQLLSYRK